VVEGGAGGLRESKGQIDFDDDVNKDDTPKNCDKVCPLIYVAV
jgi:hypothetical protein